MISFYFLELCLGSIQHFRLNTDPDPGFWWPKIGKKITAKIFLYIFWIKNCNLLIPKALKREHPSLQNMKFLNFFIFVWVIFALMDPDPHWILIQSGFGSETLVPRMPAKWWTCYITIEIQQYKPIKSRWLLVAYVLLVKLSPKSSGSGCIYRWIYCCSSQRPELEFFSVRIRIPDWTIVLDPILK